MERSMKLGSRNLLVAASLVAIVTACSKDAPKSTARTDTAVAVTGATPAAVSPTSATPANAAGAPPAYVGLHYDPLPAGISYEGGSVLFGKDGKPGSFVLSQVMTPKGHYMWLDSIIPVAGQGVLRTRVVVAELNIPAVAGDEQLFIGSCDVGGKLDGSVVAVAEHKRGQKMHKVIRRAWRADVATKSFVVIPGTGITCELPGG
jgi:hypothetical protein